MADLIPAHIFLLRASRRACRHLKDREIAYAPVVEAARAVRRLVNTPTLLAGVVRCGHCGAALIQNTGKGGQYRYYCRSRRLREGPFGCKGLRMPMDKLDGIMIGGVTKQIMQPDHLVGLLGDYLRTAIEREGRNRLQQMRQDHKEAEAGVALLLELVEQISDNGAPKMTKMRTG